MCRGQRSSSQSCSFLPPCGWTLRQTLTLGGRHNHVPSHLVDPLLKSSSWVSWPLSCFLSFLLPDLPPSFPVIHVFSRFIQMWRHMTSSAQKTDLPPLCLPCPLHMEHFLNCFSPYHSMDCNIPFIIQFESYLCQGLFFCSHLCLLPWLQLSAQISFLSIPHTKV